MRATGTASLVTQGLSYPATRQPVRDFARGNEAKFQGAVIDLAHALGWKHCHIYDAQRSEPGQPDLQLRRPPRLLFVELKTDYGRVQPDQRTVLRELALCRQDVYLWRDRMYPRPIERILGAGMVCAHNYKLVVRGGLLEACEVCGRCRGLESYS
jgi:hypothetical protein